MHLLIPGVLTVASYAGFCPIAWSDGGKPSGRDIAFLRGFAQQHGLRLLVTFYEFDRLWSRPGRDECDVAAAGITRLPDRTAPGVVWSAPYCSAQRALLIRAADAAQLRTIADFRGRTIAVMRSSTAEHDVLTRVPIGTRVLPSEQERALADLASGAIDAYGTCDAVCDYYAASSAGQFAVVDRHPYQPPDLFAFALRAVGALVDPLNDYIAAHGADYPFMEQGV